MAEILATGHSRVPVFHSGNRRNLLGLLLVREFRSIQRMCLAAESSRGLVGQATPSGLCCRSSQGGRVCIQTAVCDFLGDLAAGLPKRIPDQEDAHGICDPAVSRI